MRVLTVVGNRPQFVKAAAVSGPLRARHEEVLVHTGQHHDAAMSERFFSELELPEPDHWLGVSGGSNTSQLGRMLVALEPLMRDAAADLALVYGDTNSTLAGALAAADAALPIAHVEAGMRSHDRTMPEERNRVLVDQLAALLLCSSEQAAENLRREAAPGEIVVVGDVMADVARLVHPRVRGREEALGRLGVRAGEFLLVTVHRAGNVDVPSRLERVVELLEALPDPVVLPLHPRTRERLAAAGLLDRAQRAAMLTEPLGYLDFAELLCAARAVLTDSGGVQKEAYLAGVRCITLRDRTEWAETVDLGWNTLVDLDGAAALAALDRRPPAERPPLWGDGHAGERVAESLRLP